MDLHFIDQDTFFSDWEKASGSSNASLIPIVKKIIHELSGSTAITITNQIAYDLVEPTTEALYLLREIFVLNYSIDLGPQERIKFHRKIDLAVKALLKRATKEIADYKSQVLDQLPNGYFTVAPDWTVTYANHASEEALGFKSHDLIGKKLWDIHPALVNSQFYHAYLRTMEMRTTQEVTNYYPEQDKWYHAVSYPLEKGIAVTFTDVTLRKKAEDEKAFLDAKLRSLFEAIPQKVWITNFQGDATYFNSKTVNYTGLALEELIGGKWISIIHPDDIEETGLAWAKAVELGEDYEVEYRILAKDGSYRWHVARGIPVRNTQGKITEWIGTSTDVHDLKAIQETLKDAVIARDEFLSIASHELKTPLTSMKLQTELMKRNVAKGFDQIDLPQKLGKLLTSNEKSIDRLNRLVEDVLDVTRLSSGKLNIKTTNMNLSDLVKDIILKMKPIYGEVGLSLELPEAPVLGHWDGFRLEQVLTNLLTNAHRYGDGEPVEVTLSSTETTATLSVQDHGKGIPSEDHARIFKRFERGLNPNQVGMGLGLYITKQIVDLHNGEIEVESSSGSGSTFKITLPLNKARLNLNWSRQKFIDWCLVGNLEKFFFLLFSEVAYKLHMSVEHSPCLIFRNDFYFCMSCLKIPPLFISVHLASDDRAGA